jgi:hypothetical protein
MEGKGRYLVWDCVPVCSSSFNPVGHEYEAGILITRPGVAPIRKWYILQFKSRETIAVAAQHVIFVGYQVPVMGSIWGSWVSCVEECAECWAVRCL